MKYLLALLLCVGITSLSFAEFDIDPTNPDSLFNFVIDTQKTLKKAQTALLKTISQKDREGDKEFEARKAQLLLDGNDEIRTAQEGLRQVIDMITYTTWRVADRKVSVTASTFDKKAKEWKLSISSSDPAIPFSGTLIYNIAQSSDLAGDFKTFDAAIKAKKLFGRIEYRIVDLGDNNFGVRDLNINVALTIDDLETHGLANASQSQSWDFALGNRLKPEVTKLVRMVPVQGGTFTMGSDDSNGNNAKPLHKVTLSSFKISATEVTQAVYQKVMGTNPSDSKGDNLPVETVSWYDALEFCNKLSALEGLTPTYKIDKSMNAVTLNPKSDGYRLPTEAQWEFAARGGNKAKGTIYAGSNNIGEVAWYYDNSDYKTHDVATKVPNELGLFDMCGNVWEWCFDWFGDYGATDQFDPVGTAWGDNRVLRGGSWLNDAVLVRIAYRAYDYPAAASDFFGFRVVLP